MMPPSPPSTTSPQPTHAWDRWDWAWYALSALVVAAATWLAFADLNPPPQTRALIIGLTLAFAGWYGVMMRRSRRSWERQRLLAWFWLLLGAGLWATLIYFSPAYLLLASATFPVTFLRLPLRRALVGIILLGGILAVGTVRASDPVENLWLTILVGLIIISAAALLGLFTASVIGQSQQRQQLIEDLHAARHELAAAERQAGILEERQRLAREIHDTLAQGFTSIVMHLEAAEQALPVGADTATTQQHIDEARRTARASLAESRRVMMALRPELLEAASLPDALRQTVDQWAKGNATRLTANTTITGAPHPLAPEVETTLLRATQEALANARKYAHASVVNITLSYMDDAIVLDVQDNGGGFSPLPVGEGPGVRADGGFGLRALRERVEQLGGSLLIESAPGEGTTLVVELPAPVIG